MNQLFGRTAIGGMELRNRFVRSATAEGLTDGTNVGDQLVGMYRKLARGGVALITTGYSFVNKKGQSISKMVGLDESADLAGMRSLTAAVHDEGAKIIAQLVHAGANRFFDPGFPPQGPSAVQNRTSKAVPVEMTEKEISQTVRDFASAAKRAVACGFDAVQIHAAHEYLLSAFLSPFSNTRTDRYGGTIQNRARLPFEVYQAIRSAVGSGFPVTVKINAKDYYDDGLTAKDSAWVCRELSAIGVDAIEISATGGPEFMKIFSDIDGPAKEAYLERFAKDFKPQIKCPLILVGGLRSLGVVERLCKEGTADFFSMARPLLSEPDLISRWKSGDTRTARCISCNKCLFTMLQGGVARCYQFDGDA